MLNAKNNAETTLSVSINSSVTSIDVVDASVFPSAEFVVTIENEILKVTNVVGNTLTVVRGQEGTVASSHLGGVAVEHRWTAGMYDALVDRGSVNPFPSMPYVGASPIIESGSSANGKYVKYEDGTMISSHRLASGVGSVSQTPYISISPASTWTFPEPFYAQPDVQMSVTRIIVSSTANPISVSRASSSAYGTNNIDAIFVFYDSNSATVQTEISLLAIGRWKA